MRHPSAGFWITDGPWCVFREDRAHGRAARDVVLRNVPRHQAERAARDVNARRRLRFGRDLFYAAPQEPRS